MKTQLGVPVSDADHMVLARSDFVTERPGRLRRQQTHFPFQILKTRFVAQ